MKLCDEVDSVLNGLEDEVSEVSLAIVIARLKKGILSKLPKGTNIELHDMDLDTGSLTFKDVNSRILYLIDNKNNVIKKEGSKIIKLGKVKV